jgi:hypothetical protein
MRLSFVALLFCGPAAAGSALAQAPEAALSAPAPPGPTDTPGYRRRLDLRSGFAYRRDHLEAPGLDARSSGVAPSSFALGGQAFLETLPVGIAARLHVERFGLRPRDQLAELTTLRTTHLEVGAVALGRAVFAGGRGAVQGGLGYGLQRLPVTRLGGGAMPELEAAALTAHGPVLEAAVELGLARRVSAEAHARAMPVSFGGRYGDRAVGVRAFAAGAALGLGHVDAGPARLVGVLGYELASISGGRAPLGLGQTMHRFGLGVRAAFAPPPRPRPAPVPVEPVAAVAPAPTGRVRGIVRAAPETPEDPPGAPIAGVRVEAPGGPATTTDGEGRFSLEGLTPDGRPIALTLAADGFRTGEEVVTLSAEGDAEVELTLRRASADAPALISGLVRTESGRPIGATIVVDELGLTARADGRGFFKLSLPPGQYTLTVSAPGFVGQRKTVRVTGGEQSIHNIDMQRERR